MENSNILIATLPLLGVVLGAGLQYISHASSEKRRQKEALKIQAYVDFVRGLAGAAISQRYNDERKNQEYLTSISDAKVRISIYGSKKVVDTLADFFRDGGNVVTETGKRKLIKVCQEMRADIKNDQVADKEIAQLLYGIDV